MIISESDCCTAPWLYRKEDQNHNRVTVLGAALTQLHGESKQSLDIGVDSTSQELRGLIRRTRTAAAAAAGHRYTPLVSVSFSFSLCVLVI